MDQTRGEQDSRIAEAIAREGVRLRAFIRSRMADRMDAEDILQDVFFELVEAYRLMQPIEHVGAWLFRVARNRIVDSFRKKKPEARIAAPAIDEEGEAHPLEDLLPSPDAGPEAVYARTVLSEALADALEELPAEQREVFVAHEIEGRSFRELAAETGVNVNTLLSRKHYAVQFLRRRLEDIYADFQEGWR